MIPETYDKNSKDSPLRDLSFQIKKIRIFLLFLGIVLFLYVFISTDLWKYVQNVALSKLTAFWEATESTEIPVQVHSVFAEKLEPIYEVPMRIYAKKLGSDQKIIDASLVSVSLTPEGQLEAPLDWNTVGWYERSAKVGEEGNAILNGHYDDNYGRPAVLFNLKSLEVNDTVYLVDSFGRNFDYYVTEIFYVGIYDKNRIDKVLESEGSSLTLVTCGGVWMASEGTYNNRLVVKARR